MLLIKFFQFLFYIFRQFRFLYFPYSPFQAHQPVDACLLYTSINVSPAACIPGKIYLPVSCCRQVVIACFQAVKGASLTGIRCV